MMKTRMLIMRPEEPHETRSVELPGGDNYHRALCQLVEAMFVNEMGHLTGLPRTEAATIIYRRNTLFHEPGVYRPEQLPDIVGPAVLFEERVWR